MGLEDSAWKVFTYQFAGKPVLADGAALRFKKDPEGRDLLCYTLSSGMEVCHPVSLDPDKEEFSLTTGDLAIKGRKRAPDPESRDRDLLAGAALRGESGGIDQDLDTFVAIRQGGLGEATGD